MKTTLLISLALLSGCASRPLENPQRVMGIRLTPEPPTLLYSIRSHRAEQEFNVVEINSRKP